MRFFATVLLASSSLISPLCAAEMKAISKIDAVTVYPQGAEIIRSAEASLDAGENTLIFEGLPGDLQAETIRVEGSSTGKIDISSVDSKIVAVAAIDTDAARQKIERDIQVLQDERTALDQSINDADFQKQLMQQLATSALSSQPKDAKALSAQELGGLLDLVGGKLASLSKTRLDAQIRQREIDRQIQDLNLKISNLAPREDSRMMVTVHLAAPSAIAGTFRLHYRIENAGWKPIYDARLTSQGKDSAASLELVRRADVMQWTSEAWGNVALTLSTARPVGATSAPDLYPATMDQFDEGRARNFGRQLVPGIHVLGGAPVKESERLDDGADVVNRSVVQTEAGVEVAGFQALYAIPGRVSVDNTGTAKKVRIATDQIEAKLSARAVPKLDPNSYLTAAFILKGETPLLPGTVMLYRDGVFMGQGALPLLSPGEESKLGFGADDLIKVKRVEVRRSTSEEGLITTSNVDTRAYDITVKNLHDFAVQVTLLDQVPVSNDEKIMVENLSGMTPATETNSEKKRGVLAWRFDLEPKSEKAIKHGYRVIWPTDMKVGAN